MFCFFSVYNTEVGYTQGMNQVVAFLLFYLPEEEAFWAFCQLMTGPRWMMHGFFSPGFPKLFRFQAQFEKIMKKMLPKIYKHFLTYQVQTDLYTIRWFMLCYLGKSITYVHSISLFIYLDCLPFPLTLRLWDLYVLEGEQVLLITAFCLLRIHRKKILHLKTFDSINTFLKTDLCLNFANSHLTLDEIIEEYIVCHDKLKQNNLLILPTPTESEVPTKPFNISMGDITKLTTKTSTSDEPSEYFVPTLIEQMCYCLLEPVSSPSNNKNSSSPRIITTPMASNGPTVPAIETFLVTSSAPLAIAEDESPPIVNFRDTSIEHQYIEIKRLTKPFDNHDQQFLTEYDSCTVLSSADPSVSGYRRKVNQHQDDDDTISSKSDLMDDDDEHVQISQLLTTSLLSDDQYEHLKRSPSFYDNVIDEGDEQFNGHYLHSTRYAFDTDIR